MKRIIGIFLILSISLVCFSQTQKGFVRTPGRENKSSEEIPNVLIRLVGGHNDEKSGDDGTFTLALGNSVKENGFQIGSIRKSGYTLFNNGIKLPKLYPVSDVPIEIVMIKTDDLEREKQGWIDKGYANAEKLYKQRLAALQKDYDTKKIEEEERNARIYELEDWYTKYQGLIEGMADYYVHVDFDKLDEGLTRITKTISDGEYLIADSLINVYAPNLEDDVEQSIKAHESIRKRKVFGENIVASAIADSIEQAKKDERTASYLYAKYTTSVSDKRWDDALHYLKLRADMDTTKVDASWLYAQNALNNNKLDETLQYYRICERFFISNKDTLHLASIQTNIANIYNETYMNGFRQRE